MLAAAAALAACAGPGPSGRQPVAATPPAASAERHSTPALPPRAAPPSQLAPAILSPRDYKTGEKARKDALMNATDTVLSGQSVGYYMEVQEAELRRLLGGSGVSVASRKNRLVIGPVERAFAKGSTSLLPRGQSVLATVASVFKEYYKTLVAIHCYTDDTGAADYNRKLSQRRGLTVAHYLVKAGVTSGRIVVIGHGESDPVAPNNTARGRARNRRVEIVLIPLAREPAAPATAAEPATTPPPRAAPVRS